MNTLVDFSTDNDSFIFGNDFANAVLEMLSFIMLGNFLILIYFIQDLYLARDLSPSLHRIIEMVSIVLNSCAEVIHFKHISVKCHLMDKCTNFCAVLFRSMPH